MKPSFVHITSLFIIMVTIGLIFGIAISPVIYTLDSNVSSSVFHTNIEAQKRLIINSSTDMLPIMQEILDYSGPIALNIRMKDLESARYDLDEYARKYQKLNNLVINLEMNESEAQDFVNNTKLQDDLYNELLNSSYSLDELKRLEFRYRDREDIASLNMVAYQGQALKKKIQSIRDRYQTVSEKLIVQSEMYELDTKQVENSQIEVDKYAEEISENDFYEVKIDQNYIKKISLLITPDKGVYGDNIMYAGFASGIGERPIAVSIFIDNNLFFNITTDEMGQFRSTYQIGKISAGVHFISAQWGSTISEKLNFTVIPVKSSLNLNIITAGNFQPEIWTSGHLMTNRSVSGAPVNLIVNNETWNEVYTDLNGKYSANLTLPEGRYLINSLFLDPTFPINASTSQTYEVVSSGTSITSIRIFENSENSSLSFPFVIHGFLIFFIIICILAGIMWYRRKHEYSGLSDKIHPESGDTKNAKKQKMVKPWKLTAAANCEKVPMGEGDLLLLWFQTLIKESGLSNAGRFVYLNFLDRISGDIRAHHPLSLTPYEVMQKTMKKPYYNIFKIFILHYERIRYCGAKGEKEEEEFAKIIIETDVALDRKDHEE